MPSHVSNDCTFGSFSPVVPRVITNSHKPSGWNFMSFTVADIAYDFLRILDRWHTSCDCYTRI